MSDSPQSNPKDVEQDVQSANEDDQMNDPQDPHSSALGYEFEVKEQDRWLPIANGTFSFLPERRACLFVHVFYYYFHLPFTSTLLGLLRNLSNFSLYGVRCAPAPGASAHAAFSGETRKQRSMPRIPLDKFSGRQVLGCRNGQCSRRHCPTAYPLCYETRPRAMAQGCSLYEPAWVGIAMVGDTHPDMLL